MWSAITFSEGPLSHPGEFWIADGGFDQVGEQVDLGSWYASCCSTAAIRSRPMPVSTEGLGSGCITPASCG